MNLKRKKDEPKKLKPWDKCACDCACCSTGYGHCMKEDRGCFAGSSDKAFYEYIKKRDEEDEREKQGSSK